MKYVIIGNSAAGIAAIEGIRSTDESGEIVLVSDEPHFTYGRPLISYYLMGATDPEHMRYRPADFYEKNNVRTHFGVRAEKITRKKSKSCFRTGKRSITTNFWLRRVRGRSFRPWKGWTASRKSFRS